MLLDQGLRAAAVTAILYGRLRNPLEARCFGGNCNQLCLSWASATMFAGLAVVLPILDMRPGTLLKDGCSRAGAHGMIGRADNQSNLSGTRNTIGWTNGYGSGQYRDAALVTLHSSGQCCAIYVSARGAALLCFELERQNKCFVPPPHRADSDRCCAWLGHAALNG